MRAYSSCRILLTDQRGAALPMALIAMAILTTLIIAFSILASTEPMIASNQHSVAQARAIAESGIERATWALNNPLHANGLSEPLPATVPVPYNGSAPVDVALSSGTVGAFRVTVTNGAVSNERNIVAVGSVPSEASPRAKQRIQVTVAKFRFPDPPAALSVRGELQMGGNTLIESRNDTSCGNKVGTFTTGSTAVTDAAARVYGADGNNSKNEATDMLQGQPTATFDSYLLTDDDMAALKAYAKSQGTYYQGSVSFHSSSKMPNGVIFVDTVSGNPVTPTSDPNDMANVLIQGGAPASPDGIFHGWLVINGSLAINGDFKMYGFGYVVNDLSYTGTGTGQIEGAMMSRNIQDTSSTTIDTNSAGNAAILYDCKKAKEGGGFLPLTYAVKAGTYREVSD
jgi:Tfp pilus assembly protein PilX